MQSDFTSQTIPALEKLVAKLKPGTSTCLKSTIVALYTCDAQGKLRYSNLIGLLQLDIDRHYKSKMLRIYDLESLALGFEIELYYGLQNSIRMKNDTLAIIDYPRGCIGFLFRNKDDAYIMKSKIISNCPSMEEFEQIKKRNIEEAKKKQQKNSFFGKIKNFFSGDSDEETKASEVLAVKKLNSVKFNLEDGTFDTKNIPPEWQEMFDALSLGKEDLQDKAVVGLIMEETVMANVKRQAEKENNQDLQRKIARAEQQSKTQEREYHQQIERNTKMNLPPPPPPPPPLLVPTGNRVQSMRKSTSTNRNNLMDEIRNNNLKLKHVDVNEAKKEVTVDISEMNKEERNDHIEMLRRKLEMRKRALNRRSNDDDY